MSKSGRHVPRRRWRAGATTLGVLALTSLSAAHGGPAAITGVVAADLEGPRVVATTEGLALREAGGWRFVCPAHFGSEPTPPALSVHAARTLVVGEKDLFVLEPDGGVSAQSRPELARHFVLSLIDVGGRPHAARYQDRAFELVAVDGPLGERLWSDAGPYDSFSADGDAIWAARPASRGGVAVRIALDGTTSGEVVVPVEPDEAVAWVGTAAGTLHAVLRTPSFGGRLVRLGADGGAETVLRTQAPVLGPVATRDGTVWAAGDALLTRFGVEDPSPTESALAVGCLGRVGPLTFLCSRTRLLALEPDGPGAVLADLRDLLPPDLDRVEPTRQSACRAEWEIFRSDLEAIGAIAPLDAGEPHDAAEPAPRRRASDSGCAASGGTAPPRGAALVLAWAAVSSILRRWGPRK